MTPGEFAEVALAYCIEMQGSEVAGYRTPRLAETLGDDPHDPHRAGMARDVVYDQLPSLASAITTAERYGLFLYRNPSHDHIEPSDWRKRGDSAHA